MDKKRSPIVEAKEVWKLYRVGDEVVRALVGVDLIVHRGEFVCLMGPSGSGKTSLLYILGGLDRPTKGSLAIDGQPTASLTESQFSVLRHSKIGFIFQTFNLIPFLDALENVELPLVFEPIDRSSLRARARELLELVGLAHRSSHIPAKLSGGEQQRTAIARALISSPALILADEPTANLDHATGMEVISLMRELCKGMDVAVVAATHDHSVAEQASRVIHLVDGRAINTRDPPSPSDEYAERVQMET
jgi:putative ABC transport system ATP-binding protein